MTVCQEFKNRFFFIVLNSPSLNGIILELSQAEPTRRSARLKSIQVKQALKDESVFDDDDDDDFQTRKIRTKVTTVSKGVNGCCLNCRYLSACD
jgi:hypothetical protein